MNLLFLLHLVLFNHWKSLPTLYVLRMFAAVHFHHCFLANILQAETTIPQGYKCEIKIQVTMQIIFYGVYRLCTCFCIEYKGKSTFFSDKIATEKKHHCFFSNFHNNACSLLDQQFKSKKSIGHRPKLRAIRVFSNMAAGHCSLLKLQPCSLLLILDILSIYSSNISCKLLVV